MDGLLEPNRYVIALLPLDHPVGVTANPTLTLPSLGREFLLGH